MLGSFVFTYLTVQATLADRASTSTHHVCSQIISHCKPFSSFKAEEAYSVLNTTLQYADDAPAEFPLAPYDPAAQADSVMQRCLNFQAHGDIIHHAGKELAMRCCKTDPDRYSKDASKREFISPVIFAAAALAGALIHFQCLYVTVCTPSAPTWCLCTDISQACCRVHSQLQMVAK